MSRTCFNCFFALTILCQGICRADIRTWDTREVIEGTESIEPGPGVDLSMLFLDRALFDGVNLEQATFLQSYLYEASFKGTNLLGAHFQMSRLEMANFTGANLEGADFREAVLQDADLSHANLTRANLGGGCGSACRPGPDLTGANFSFANLQGANLLPANATHANFANANFSNAFMHRRGFGGFSSINLTGADTRGAVDFTLTDEELQDKGTNLIYPNGQMKSMAIGDVDNLS